MPTTLVDTPAEAAKKEEDNLDWERREIPELEDTGNWKDENYAGWRRTVRES